MVAATLRRDAPFSAEEVVREIARYGVGRATVFRTLDLLVSIGALSRVHGIEEGGRCVRYTPCAPAHHHHLVCRSCGATVEVDGPAVESWADRVAAEHGFTSVSHTLEIFGTCPECAHRAI